MERGNLRGEVSLCGMYVLNFYNLTGKEERRQVVRIAYLFYSQSKPTSNCSAAVLGND